MNILKQLSEEIFDFSKSSITSARAQELKTTMSTEFSAIFELCLFVIDLYITNPESIKTSLVKMTLKTFGATMSWIPLGFIFDTPIVAKLVQNLLQENFFRVETIKCLTEIAGLREQIKKQQGNNPFNKAYEEFLLMMFIQIMSKMESIIQGIVLNEEYYRIPPERQGGYETFCLQFGLLLTTFMQGQIDLIEEMLSSIQANPKAIAILLNKASQALIYIMQLSNIPNDEIFKICVEFWNFISSYVYDKVANESISDYTSIYKYYCRYIVDF
jgi:exportin-1